MTIEENKDVVRRFFKAFEDGDLDQILGLITDDFTWWIPPTTIASGTYPRDQWIELITASLADLAAPMSFKLGELTAENDRVSIIVAGNAPLKNGKVYKNHYHILFWLSDGKISVGKEYQDTYHVGEIYGFPNSVKNKEPSLS